eukprot:Gb_27160 [translate_table: standard]
MPSISPKGTHKLVGHIPIFPRIFGHEATGIVESVGEGVTDLHEGDRVLTIFTGECKECRHCKSTKSNMCEILGMERKGVMHSDQRTRFSINGKPVYHFCAVSSFSEYTVVHSGCTVKLNSDTPLGKISILSCGVATARKHVRKWKDAACSRSQEHGGIGWIFKEQNAQMEQVEKECWLKPSFNIILDPSHAKKERRDELLDTIESINDARAQKYRIYSKGSKPSQNAIAKVMLHKILPLPDGPATILSECMEEISVAEIEEAMNKMESGKTPGLDGFLVEFYQILADDKMVLFIWKAYDTMEWDYILAALKCKGVSSLALKWIRAILKTTNFSIAINGRLTPIIYASRGFRPLTCFPVNGHQMMFTHQLFVDEVTFMGSPRIAKVAIWNQTYAFASGPNNEPFGQRVHYWEIMELSIALGLTEVVDFYNFHNKTWRNIAMLLVDDNGFLDRHLVILIDQRDDEISHVTLLAAATRRHQ